MDELARFPNLTITQQQQCLTLGVEIAQSTIPDAGFGLFTTIARKKGDLLVPYEGKHIVLSKSYEGPHPEGPFVLQVNNRTFLDGANESYGLGRFVNCCRQTDTTKFGLRNNARFCINARAGNVNIRATRSIAPGDEVFAPYGSSYRWFTKRA